MRKDGRMTPQQATRAIADFLEAHTLFSTAGTTTAHVNEPDTGRKYHEIFFGVPMMVYGDIRVYSATFVMVNFRLSMYATGKYPVLGDSNWPGYVYASVSDALAFLELAFIRNQNEAAWAVPRRVKQGTTATTGEGVAPVEQNAEAVPPEKEPEQLQLEPVMAAATPRAPKPRRQAAPRQEPVAAPPAPLTGYSRFRQMLREFFC